ncbi:MAG: hypothetical protein FWD36_08400 [Treponema sp.]|nr:hypothetical protein [Treponema sp.]
MGLLEKAISRRGNAESIQAVIIDFHCKNPLFHCIVLQSSGGNEQTFLQDITGRIAGHGAVCAELSGGKCLVLLPGGLDMELFAHRLSKSTVSAVMFQLSAYESSVVLAQLKPYLW